MLSPAFFQNLPLNRGIRGYPVNTFVRTKLPLLFAENFRSTFEAEVVHDLTLRDPTFRIEDHYESARIAYTVPARKADYTPDLYWPEKRLIVEVKGRFQDVAERMKYIYFVESNPEITLKFVLQRPGVKIYKGSKTTQEAWLQKHGFEVAFGTVPAEWLA